MDGKEGRTDKHMERCSRVWDASFEGIRFSPSTVDVLLGLGLVSFMGVTNHCVCLVKVSDLIVIVVGLVID